MIFFLHFSILFSENPRKIFFLFDRCIGTLVNSGLEEIIQRILRLSDISAEMSEQYCSLLNQVNFYLVIII